MDTKDTADGRVNSGVIRVLSFRDGAPPVAEQRERARVELHLALTKRGIAVDPLSFRERDFTQGAATYFEVSVEHEPMTGERRDELVAAFELGQMSGRYAARLKSGKEGAHLNGPQWGEELRAADRNPWRGDCRGSWPDDLNDPLVAFVLAYAWKLGYVDGDGSVTEDRPLRRAPYAGPPVTFENRK